MLVGTALYLSPEQAIGADIDARSDFYSLGVTLYELVCGERPFTGERAEIVQRHRYDTPPPPSRLNVPVPPVLEHLILRLLSKRPDGRPASAEAVRAALLSTPSCRPRPADDSPPASSAAPTRSRAAATPSPAHSPARAAGRDHGRAGDRQVADRARAGRRGGSRRRRRAVVRLPGGDGRAGVLAVAAAAARAADGDPPPAAVPARSRRADPRPRTGLRAGGAAADPEEARFRTFEAIIACSRPLRRVARSCSSTRTCNGPTRCSIRLLCHLARRVSTMRLLLFATYRDGDVGEDDPLNEVADVLPTRTICGWRCAGSTSRRSAVHRADGGRPLAAARARARRPHGRQPVLRRRDRPDAAFRGAAGGREPQCGASRQRARGRRTPAAPASRRSVRQTLYAAAVQGTEFELDVLAATAEVPRLDVYDALEIGRATHLVQPEGGRHWRFVHVIIRDAVASRIPGVAARAPARRRRPRARAPLARGGGGARPAFRGRRGGRRRGGDARGPLLA